MESLIAAVRGGADAVYLGSTEFSARRNAKNFDNAELKEAVEYCHIRGVKVYLTLNIMLKDYELDSALHLAEYANKIGVDALILQDLGLSYIIKKRFPDLAIHASTQMTVHEKSALPLLKRLGFSRVVVSREMSKNEIKEFCLAAKDTGIEVEVFVHGALCMSVSGQCLLSAVLGARSGNRGLCAGPCRLPFKAKNGTGYDLSLKDLCLLDEVSELSALGVSSLKIEGRMKRPEYVAVSAYAARQAADGKPADADMLALLQNTFSRSGFTKGYYNGKLGREMFGIRTKDDVLSSADAYSEIHALYRNERQSVPITVNAVMKKNTPLEVSFSDGKNTVIKTGSIPDTAKNKPTDGEMLSASLCKLGGTPYYAENFNITAEDGLFLPSSVLNSVRREGIDGLNEMRKNPPERRETDFCEILRDAEHFCGKIFARFLNPDMMPLDLSGIDGVILPSEYDFPALPDNIIKITDTPRYIKDGERLFSRLKELKQCGVDYALCGNLSGVLLAREAGLTVIGDTGLNAANSYSAAVLEKEGVFAVTLSAEITLKDINKIKTPLKKGIFAYGRLPLMLTRNCPLKNGGGCAKCDKKGFLTDRTGTKFPVRCRTDYSELLNSAPMYLADKLNEIKGIDYLILSFTTETKEEINAVIRDYKNGGEPTNKFTRGLYFKGVL